MGMLRLIVQRTAPESINWPCGVSVIFASRRSESGDVMRAADSHFSPSAEVITRKCAIGRNVRFAFAKHAVPAVFEANEIGERVVRRLVPNFAASTSSASAATAMCDAHNSDTMNRMRFTLAPFGDRSNVISDTAGGSR